MLYPVNEVFQSLQGEARFTGTPAVFLRLQGCDVGCPWCDTKHTWPVDEANRISADELLAKTKDAPTYSPLSATQIAALIRERFKAEHVVITGGEPCAYDLEPLCAALNRMDIVVQVETSGSRPIRVSWQTWVTVSPKVNMPGADGALPEALERANEIKFPVGRPRDVEYALKHLAPVARRRAIPLWLQPLSASDKATALCIEAATEHGWRVSLQTHKFIGVR
jgi:7-carboxy-7-deazaguanine synthase